MLSESDTADTLVLHVKNTGKSSSSLQYSKMADISCRQKKVDKSNERQSRVAKIPCSKTP